MDGAGLLKADAPTQGRWRGFFMAKGLWPRRRCKRAALGKEPLP